MDCFEVSKISVVKVTKVIECTLTFVTVDADTPSLGPPAPKTLTALRTSPESSTCTPEVAVLLPQVRPAAPRSPPLTKKAKNLTSVRESLVDDDTCRGVGMSFSFCACFNKQQYKNKISFAVTETCC